MKKFEKPSVLVVKFDLEDVVTASAAETTFPQDNFELPPIEG